MSCLFYILHSIYFVDPELKHLKHSMDVISTKSLIYEKGLPDPSITPVTTILKWVSEVIPLSKSIIHKLESRSVADTGNIHIHSCQMFM